MGEVGVEEGNGKPSQEARKEIQQNKCSKQIPAAALGNVTPYTSARGGMPANSINLLGSE